MFDRLNPPRPAEHVASKAVASEPIAAPPSPVLTAKEISEAATRRILLALSHDKQVNELLESLWQACNTQKRGNIIEWSEYDLLNRKLLLAIRPEVGPVVARQMAQADWDADSERQPGIDRERFVWCCLELAELCTRTLDRHKLIAFLRSTCKLAVRVESDGSCAWKPDREVILGHMHLRHAEGIDDTEIVNLERLQRLWEQPAVEAQPSAPPAVVKKPSPPPPQGRQMVFNAPPPKPGSVEARLIRKGLEYQARLAQRIEQRCNTDSTSVHTAANSSRNHRTPIERSSAPDTRRS